jgi:hypothetical protein
MSELSKSSKKLIHEVYTYTFNKNEVTTSSIGANAGVSNLIFKLYDKKTNTHVGYIMYTENYRTLSLNYSNVQAGIFFNNYNDLINLNYIEVNRDTKTLENTEKTVKATYSSGKYENKDVNVRLQFLKNSKRIVTLTYEA